MRSDEYPRIFPLGDSAVTVEFGSVLSQGLNRKAIALAAQLDNEPFEGYIECVPAYASTTIFYDPAAVRRANPHLDSAYEVVRSIVAANISGALSQEESYLEPIVIPIDVSARAGLDLEFLAVNASMTVNEVLSIFLSATYRVYMLGFLPGFPYMGDVDERIAAPRRRTPRTIVPRGSVGIAGRQTGIYPFESPGGWQLIGRTLVDIFNADRHEPCLLKPGDRVHFVPV